MIHQYVNNGYYIVLDVASGAVHSVDPLAYDVIAWLDKEIRDPKAEDMTPELYEKACTNFKDRASREDIMELMDEIKELIKDGQLFFEDPFEKYIGDVKARKTVIKAMCLHIAHDCNLACEYCFAEEGEYHGRRAIMSYEVGKQALDFLIASSGNRRNLEVDFFGGEPLMNWEVVKKLVA